MLRRFCGIPPKRLNDAKQHSFHSHSKTELKKKKGNAPIFFITSCQEGKVKKKGGKSRQTSSYCWLILTGHEQTQATGRCTDLCDVGDPVHAALVLLVVLGAGERIRHERRATEDRGMRGGTDVEFGEGVKVDLNLVRWVALALSLDLACLD